MKKMHYIEVESAIAFATIAQPPSGLCHYAFQGIDFNTQPTAIQSTYDDCIFMGCKLPDAMHHNISPNCIILPHIDAPYKVFPATLYTAQTLYDGYNPGQDTTFEQCYDTRVYRHYMAYGRGVTDIKESLCRTLHDHSISDALHDILSHYDERNVIAVMGGHSLLRTDTTYTQIARIARTLTEQGRLMISGGGPGAMEATHLGAYMAFRPDSDLTDAIKILSSAPSYKDSNWLSTAFEVIQRYSRVQEGNDIGIPTWFYGHEPATPFAAHIAKYFDNSIREDGLLAIAKGGVIFAPGSAGTMQEVFQDAAQNHYKTFGYASPMIFLDREYWFNKMPVYPLLQELMKKERYKNLLLSTADNIEEVTTALNNFLSETTQNC